MARRAWTVLAVAVLVTATAAGCNSGGKKHHSSTNGNSTTKTTSKPSTDTRTATPSASSSTYRPKENPLLTSCVTAQSGKTCEFHGSKFKPGEQVVLTRTGAGTFSQTVTADAQGQFTQTVVITAAPDSYVFTARGKDSGGSATASVQLKAAG